MLLLCACAGERVPEPRPFNERLAWAHLAEQVAFGPRVAGLPPHQRMVPWLRGELAFRADTVEVQEFTGPGPEGKSLRHANLVARWRPEARHRILLATHWDSPPRATRDPEDHLRRRPVPGAGEGASGTAVLLEIAQLLHETPPREGVGVDLVFTDGLGRGPGGAGLGARHFVATLPPARRPAWAVYVDRVADGDLRIPVEGSSAAAVVRRVWDAARAAGEDSVFVRAAGPVVQGDHQVLNAAGIPTAAVIDPEMGRGNELWRTTDDSLENARQESLARVGRVLAALVYAERAAP